MAAMELEGSRFGAVAAEGVQHLVGEFREHGGVILAVDKKCVAASAHAAFHVGHRANGSPEFAQFLDGYMVPKTLPDVIGGHALADDVSVIGRDVEKAARANCRVMNESDGADGRAKAGAEDAEFGVTLLFKPAKAAAGILDGLAVGLESQTDVGAADLIGALMTAGHAAVVVGQAQLQCGDPEAGNPFAEAILAMPFGVPVGKDEDSGASRGFYRRAPTARGGPEPGVDGIVFGPGGFDGTGKGEDIFGVEAVVGGRSRGVPLVAVFNGILRVLADKSDGIGIAGGATYVFEAPRERLDSAVVVRGPAVMLVAADFAFEPVHKGSSKLLVYSSWSGKEKCGAACGGVRKNRKKNNAETQKTQNDAENKALGMGHAGEVVC